MSFSDGSLIIMTSKSFSPWEKELIKSFERDPVRLKTSMINLKEALNIVFKTPEEQIYLFTLPASRRNRAVLMVQQVDFICSTFPPLTQVVKHVRHSSQLYLSYLLYVSFENTA